MTLVSGLFFSRNFLDLLKTTTGNQVRDKAQYPSTNSETLKEVVHVLLTCWSHMAPFFILWLLENDANWTKGNRSLFQTFDGDLCIPKLFLFLYLVFLNATYIRAFETEVTQRDMEMDVQPGLNTGLSLS